MTDYPEEQDRVVIRDNRKIDPVTGEARKASPAAEAPAEAPAETQAADAKAAPVDEPAAAMVEAGLLDERTRDLQRVQAEYANYRKRMDREVLAAEQRGVGRTLAALLPVLDDWDRAREHGDLTGPLATIVEKEQRALADLGLEAIGAEGDPFDPTLHEAVLHDESDAVDVPTCTKILRKGYRHGERLLRPAMVGVSDPASPAAAPAPPEAGEPSPAGQPSEQQ